MDTLRQNFLSIWGHHSVHVSKPHCWHWHCKCGLVVMLRWGCKCTSVTHYLLFSFSMSPPICLFDVNSTKSQRNPSAFFAPYHPVAYTFPAWRYLRTNSEDLTPLALAHFTPWASSTQYSRNSTHRTGFVSRGSKIWQLQMHINYAIRSNMKNVKLDFGFKLLVWRCIA